MSASKLDATLPPPALLLPFRRYHVSNVLSTPQPNEISFGESTAAALPLADLGDKIILRMTLEALHISLPAQTCLI
jgi:hypothetical protein